MPQPGHGPGAPAGEMPGAEREIIAMVIQGLSNDAIAARRGTSARTVANQLQVIYRKLGIGSRLELATIGQAGALDRRR